VQSGGLAPLRVPADGSSAKRELDTRTPLLPVTLHGERLPIRSDPPHVGSDTEAVLQELGYAAAEIERLAADGVIARYAGPDVSAANP
jgi:crotonobetainyl-CoA:carnitine CoA-transferase CaiB-like acyl-CoA transferase